MVGVPDVVTGAGVVRTEQDHVAVRLVRCVVWGINIATQAIAEVVPLVMGLTAVVGVGSDASSAAGARGAWGTAGPAATVTAGT